MISLKFVSRLFRVKSFICLVGCERFPWTSQRLSGRRVTPAIETVTTRNSVTVAATADFDVQRLDAIRRVTRGIRDN